MTTYDSPTDLAPAQDAPDQTSETVEGATHDAIMAAFVTADRVLPRAALVAAAARWPEVGAPMITLLEDAAAGATLSEEDESVLFFALFVMAQVRETRAFQPLCELASQADRLLRVLGDGVLEYLAGVFVRVFDGDVGRLQALIETPTASEYLREPALNALAWLTADGQIDRAETSIFLENLFEKLRPDTDLFVWVGWQGAIAMLGLSHLAPLVRRAFDTEAIDPTITDFEHFQSDLDEAMRAPDPAAFVAKQIAHVEKLDDPVALLSTWAWFQPERPHRVEASRPKPPAVPRRSSPKVGRNEPCPCGSGKKYKKCCLDQAA